MEAGNWFGASDEEGNLPVLISGQIRNPTEDDMAVLFWLVIKIDDENDPALENVLEKQYKHPGNGQEGGKVWK